MRYVPYPSYQTPTYGGTSYNGVPTIGDIGGYGYNNGYYNQYYNPWYARQQQEAQRQMQLQQQQTQINVWKRLIKCRDNAYGYHNTLDEIESQILDSIKEYQKMAADERFVNETHLIAQKCFESQMQEQVIQENIEKEKQIQQTTESQEEPKSLYQWLHEDGQERYMQSQYAEMVHQRRNVSNIYDSNGYRELLGVHDSVFNSLNQEITIDDMEIQVALPEHLKHERDIRRQQFAAALKAGL